MLGHKSVWQPLLQSLRPRDTGGTDRPALLGPLAPAGPARASAVPRPLLAPVGARSVGGRDRGAAPRPLGGRCCRPLLRRGRLRFQRLCSWGMAVLGRPSDSAAGTRGRRLRRGHGPDATTELTGSSVRGRTGAELCRERLVFGGDRTVADALRGRRAGIVGRPWSYPSDDADRHPAPGGLGVARPVPVVLLDNARRPRCRCSPIPPRPRRRAPRGACDRPGAIRPANRRSRDREPTRPGRARGVLPRRFDGPVDSGSPAGVR